MREGRYRQVPPCNQEGAPDCVSQLPSCGRIRRVLSREVAMRFATGGVLLYPSWYPQTAPPHRLHAGFKGFGLAPNRTYLRLVSEAIGICVSQPDCRGDRRNSIEILLHLFTVAPRAHLGSGKRLGLDAGRGALQKCPALGQRGRFTARSRPPSSYPLARHLYTHSSGPYWP